MHVGMEMKRLAFHDGLDARDASIIACATMFWWFEGGYLVFTDGTKEVGCAV